MPTGAAAVLEARTVENANANLLGVLTPGLSVLDVGCGSGAITRGIASYAGRVVGIDRSEELIQLANAHNTLPNLSFIAGDIMTYTPAEQFDIITTARTLQWMAGPEGVIRQMLTLLKPGGLLCVLDYNHEAIQWQPAPPASMQHFYDAFLKWRADAGMDNAIGDHVAMLMANCGGVDIVVQDQHEFVEKGKEGMNIWKTVAETRGQQVVRDGYVTEEVRLAAIADYEQWIKESAISMQLYLKATHARF
jgi:trans-aconitate methyltransferase